LALPASADVGRRHKPTRPTSERQTQAERAFAAIQADEALDLARETGVNVDRCYEALRQADDAFAAAVPRTAAGVRFKNDAAQRHLATIASGDTLTEAGAVWLALQFGSVAASVLQMRLVG